jgi:hypothetical protein
MQLDTPAIGRVHAPVGDRSSGLLLEAPVIA